MSKRVLCSLSLVIMSIWAYSQCPLTFNCEEAVTICSFQELNEYQCTNNQPTGPINRVPLCLGLGSNENAGYLSFVGDGQPIEITITTQIQNCQFGLGLEVAVYEGECSQGQIWDCDVSCGQNAFTLFGPTKKYQVYYMAIDGCNGDICPFRITVDRPRPAQTLPDSMGQIELLGDFCPGGQVTALYTRFRDTCYPNLLWNIPSLPFDFTGDSISFTIPEDAQPGSQIDFELIVGIGNPQIPQLFCDSDTLTISSPPIAPIEKRLGSCLVVCYEDQPFNCSGLTMSGDTCIKRVKPVGEPCLVDSLFPIEILNQPGVGELDTILCLPGEKYIAENGAEYAGDVCGTIVQFEREYESANCPGQKALCDTSYRLYLLSADYTNSFDVDCAPCSGQVTICANVQPKTSCSYWNNKLSFDLEWFDQITGSFIDQTKGNGCITVTTAGTYEVEVTMNYQGEDCVLLNKDKVNVDPSLFFTPIITGDTLICPDSFGRYTITRPAGFCSANWRVIGSSGSILTPSPEDSTSIEVKWGSLNRDTALVCVEVTTDCNITDVCQEVAICPKTTSTSSEETSSVFFSTFFRQWVVEVPSDGPYQFEVYNLLGNKVLQSTLSSKTVLTQPNEHSGIFIGVLRKNGRVVHSIKASVQ